MQYKSNGASAGTWTTFWFEKNLQGDIIAAYAYNGTKLVTYSYDAYGKCTETFAS